LAEFSLILSQFRHLTERRTDERANHVLKVCIAEKQDAQLSQGAL